MPTTECKHCGGTIATTANLCPHCGGATTWGTVAEGGEALSGLGCGCMVVAAVIFGILFVLGL